MSIQADTEILSIRVMEAYAKKNHISGKEAIDIFHQYQLFEKIMIHTEIDSLEFTRRLAYE